jgi:6-phosphofructo-2-kinase/fructose-2,6-biphosphatase 2
MNKTIYLTRHGQSENNIKGIIGGDSNLTSKGIEYAKKLGLFLKNENLSNINLWTSTKIRTNQTLNHAIDNMGSYNLRNKHKIFKNLDEINAGICEEMTYKEIKEKYPEEYKSRQNNKLQYKYLNGESYLDLIDRLEPIINKLNNTIDPVVVISHNAIIRVLVSYYKNISREEMPFIEIPLHTVIKIKYNNGKYNTGKYNVEFIKI